MTPVLAYFIASYLILAAFAMTAMWSLQQKVRCLERKLRDAEVLASALRRLLTSIGVETTITDTSDGYAIQTVQHHRPPREWH
jgi:Zn-dependent peptidase ImmA (M78 family)